jgi:hypothetical protein
MTTARQTYTNSVASAVATANSTINAATVLQQETVNSAGNACRARSVRICVLYKVSKGKNIRQPPPTKIYDRASVAQS